MPESSTRIDGFAFRRLAAHEANACGERLRSIFRDAVLAAGPTHFSAEHVAAWAGSADDVERWRPRLADGMTWVATTSDEAERPIGFALRRPVDYLDLLFVDPAFHRRGLGGALLEIVADDARADGVVSLSADASPISYPVFVAAGYDLVAWEDVEHRGLTFRRARMQKAL